MADQSKPFEGAISRYFSEEAPADIQAAIRSGGKDEILNPAYPYDQQMKRKEYERQMQEVQVELVRLQAWAKKSGARIAILFEGRDAAGKGGTIKRFRANLNPRSARVVALSKPSDTERSQWYFQRYIPHLPASGELVFFDRSWYNRGVVEHVFGWCSKGERQRFFKQVGEFEKMLVQDGIHLFKIWLTVGRAEQLRRFLKRESDPLKQWKLSPVDVQGLSKWDLYTEAIRENFQNSHSPESPWIVIRSDDKKRARLAAMRSVLSQLQYDGKKAEVACPADEAVAGGPEMIDG